MKSVLFSIALLVSAVGWANTPDEATVKVRSFLCGRDSKERVGSGVLISALNKTYVLTSSETHFSQDKERVCYSVSNHSGSAKAQLKKKDWGWGLSLLEMPTPLPESHSVVLQPNPSQGGAAVKLSGFELLSTSLTLQNGTTLTAKSDRHSMPFVKYLTEVMNTEVEAGFVGGPVWDSSNSLVGIVTSEYLRILPGRPTFPFPWKQEAGFKQKHLLVLPTAALAEWVTQVLQTEALAPLTTQLDDELKNTEVVYTGGLRFESKTPPDNISDPASGTFPIGGADGGGIGGADSSFLFNKIQLQTTNLGQKEFIVPGYAGWAKHAVEISQKHPIVELPFVVFRGMEGALAHGTFRSLRGFFKYLNRGTAVLPVLLTPGSDSTISPLFKEARTVSLGAVDFFLKPTIMTENISALMHEMYLVSAVASSDVWKSLNLSEVEQVANDDGKHSFAWAILDKFGAKQLPEKCKTFWNAAKKVYP